MTKTMKNFSPKRRQVLKYMALFSAVPFVDNAIGRGLFAKEVKSFTDKLVINGEVITGTHYGIIKATVKDGKIISTTQGVKRSVHNPMCDYGADVVYAKDRIKYPMVRKSYLENPDNPKPELRGNDEWVRVSYDEAIKLAANAMKKVRAKKGASGIYSGSYGWKSPGNLHKGSVLLKRFMGMSGGYVDGLGDFSTGASQVIMRYVTGNLEVYDQQTSWPIVLESSKVVIIWGANPYRTLRLSFLVSDGMGLEYLDKLRTSGKTIICIDPVRSETCEFLNARHEAIVPNTDVALMLGMAYHMYTTNNYDKKFIETYTTGFDKFTPYLLGKTDGVKKTPKWAEGICGVKESVIKELAELCFKNRTMIMTGWVIQRQQYGEQKHWMIATLASMIGQIGLPGGGFGISYHYANGGNPTTAAPVIGGIGAGDVDKSKWFKGESPNIPVVRFPDMILNPGKTIEYNGRKITYPDIDLVYWVGGNPVNQQMNLNKMIKAWRKPNTMIVNDIYWTQTARFADIVFPITTTYERNDISMSGDYSNMHIVPMKQVVKAQYESVSDYKVFSDLSKEFGIYDKFTEGKDEMQWIQSFYEKAEAQAKVKETPIPTFEEFWTANQPLEFYPQMEGENYVRYADFREDPILESLGTQSGLIEIYSKQIESYKYDDCPAHPTWLEPFEWLGMKNKPAEFALISPHPDKRLHSQLDNTGLKETYTISGREPVWINPQDAKAKGIKQGDIVRVFNKRGHTIAGALVTDKIMKGCVQISEGSWYDPDFTKDYGKFGPLALNGTANVLTADIVTSRLANGNCAETALVNIEKFKGKVPPLNVYKQPKMAKKS